MNIQNFLVGLGALEKYLKIKKVYIIFPTDGVLTTLLLSVVKLMEVLHLHHLLQPTVLQAILMEPLQPNIPMKQQHHIMAMKQQHHTMAMKQPRDLTIKLRLPIFQSQDYYFSFESLIFPHQKFF